MSGNIETVQNWWSAGNIIRCRTVTDRSLLCQSCCSQEVWDPSSFESVSFSPITQICMSDIHMHVLNLRGWSWDDQSQYDRRNDLQYFFSSDFRISSRIRSFSCSFSIRSWDEFAIFVSDNRISQTKFPHISILQNASVPENVCHPEHFRYWTRLFVFDTSIFLVITMRKPSEK